MQAGSAEYQQVCRLRHRVLFAAAGGEARDVCDRYERASTHMALRSGKDVLACGRLTRLGAAQWRISRVAVDEVHRGRGLGSRILAALLCEVVSRGGGRIELAAREYAVGFYRRFGFVPVGEAFASPETGLPHVMMVLELSAN